MARRPRSNPRLPSQHRFRVEASVLGSDVQQDLRTAHVADVKPEAQGGRVVLGPSSHGREGFKLRMPHD